MKISAMNNFIIPIFSLLYNNEDCKSSDTWMKKQIFSNLSNNQ